MITHEQDWLARYAEELGMACENCELVLLAAASAAVLLCDPQRVEFSTI